MRQQDRPRNFGTIPQGWSPEDWIDYLRHRAKACRTTNPDAAAMYDEWADVISDPEDE